MKCRLILTVLIVVTDAIQLISGNVDDELKLLSKQVKTLLDRRRDDLKLIENSLRKRLIGGSELSDVKDELKILRQEIEELRTGSKIVHVKSSTIGQQNGGNQEKNDHLTVKWLAASMQELKSEMGELQQLLNTTAMLNDRQTVEGEMYLLRTDVSNLSRELEGSRTQNARYEAELNTLRDELRDMKENNRATAVSCGRTKNQLKSFQLEWNSNWKKLMEEERTPVPLIVSGEQQSKPNNFNVVEHPSRHRRVMKKHILDLERNAKHLRRTNEELQRKLLKLEEDVQIIQNAIQIERRNGVNDNEIDDFGETIHAKGETIHRKPQKYYNGKLIKLEEQQIENTNALYNLTLQLANFDKLHMSMLELLENVESIENKVDKTLPDFRKEISKLELQMSEQTSRITLITDDHTNMKETIKAIAVSVSNVKDKMDVGQQDFNNLLQSVENLKKSTTFQSSKLHDYILKTESASSNTNVTKSAIYLVEELKNFEHEYKSIVNKLPHDCNSVTGPDGLYLVSPGDGEPILANCESGWTTIQKRADGSVNFNRNWNDYSNGFGSASGEYWIGNRNLHSLTKDNCTMLKIDMQDIYGKYWQAIYGHFVVDDFTKGFKLTVSGYSGNASDALDYQNNMEFSTVDNDRDISNTHCASNYEGGWWFSHCQHANLNGRYNLGLTWFDSKRNEWIAVATSVMKIKKRDVC